MCAALCQLPEAPGHLQRVPFLTVCHAGFLLCLLLALFLGRGALSRPLELQPGSQGPAQEPVLTLPGEDRYYILDSWDPVQTQVTESIQSTDTAGEDYPDHR